MKIIGKRNSAQNTVDDRTMRTAAVRRGFRPSKRMIYVVCSLLAALFVVATAMVIHTVADRKEYKTYMALARQSEESGDYDTALTALRKALAVEKTEECSLSMAKCYEAMGNYEKALEVLRTLNVQDKTVSAMINAIELKRDELKNAEKVEVLGKLYPVGTSSLVLDSAGLVSADLEELRQLYSLSNLSLADNEISDISALSSLGGLTTLNLSHNKITDISALTALTGLRTLYLDGNPVSDLSPLCDAASLTSLSIKGIDVTGEMIEQLSKALPNCAIQSDTAQEKNMDISFGGVTFKNDVTTLSLSGMGIHDISALACCTELESLDISGNEISDLSPLMNMPKLSWLDVSYNKLGDVKTLMGMSELKFLNASGNNILSTTPLGMMTGLQELYLDGNPINDFSGLRKMKSLKKLGLSNTGITDNELVYLEGLGQLVTLNVSDNDALTGEGIDNLQAKINPCEITHSKLNYSIDFMGHAVKSTSTELDLTGTGISDISPMQFMPELENVMLGKNSISNLYPLQYSNSRFTIKYMDLSNNFLEDITPLSWLTNVEVLDLSNNSISSELPLLRLGTLKKLYIGGNLLTEEQIENIRFELPGCEVVTE